MAKSKRCLLVELQLPLAGMECSAVRCYDLSGKPIPGGVSRIEIEPLFIRSEAMPAVAYGRVLVKTGEQLQDLHRHLICVAGATGELRVKNLLDVGPKCLEDGSEASGSEAAPGDMSEG